MKTNVTQSRNWDLPIAERNERPFDSLVWHCEFLLWSIRWHSRPRLSESDKSADNRHPGTTRNDTEERIEHGRDRFSADHPNLASTLRTLLREILRGGKNAVSANSGWNVTSGKLRCENVHDRAVTRHDEDDDRQRTMTPWRCRDMSEPRPKWRLPDAFLGKSIKCYL